ncbi:MAG TPA: nucleoside triphosphate pyrophosphatase [Sphingomicrobium sp.]|nr:nucleoside triphosphate pyrophosphatase [Sphingomicrobium sp.]
MPLILASASAIRRTMLEQAGVGFAVSPAAVDEHTEKALHEDPASLAEALAVAKAVAGSGEHPEDWVIGSDSVASAGGRRFDKPASRDEAAEHLRFFSGKVLQLTSAVALARDGACPWTHTDTARLDVRQLSDRFIEDYLDTEWPEIGYCAGAFRLEGLGVQLFERIEGSYFTILGMPLLPLLGALRERQLIAS